MLVPMLICASALAAKTPPPTSADLIFAWPESGTATVTTKTVRTKSVPAPLVITSSDTTRLDVHADGDRRVLQYTTLAGTSTTTKNGEEVPEDSLMKQLGDTLESIPAEVTIGPKGEWLGLTDEEGLKKQVGDAIDAFVSGAVSRAQDDAAKARLQAYIRPFQDHVGELAVADVRKDWIWETAYWTGAKLTVGKRYSTTSSGGTNAITGTPQSFHVDFEVLDVVRCGKGRKSPWCADIDLNVAASPEDMLAAVQANFDANPQTAGAKASEASYTEHRVGRVEVDTLRPLSWTVDTATRTLVTNVGPSQATMQIDETVHEEKTWAWDKAR